MAALTAIPFGGLAGLLDNNLLSLSDALYADDCYIDADTIISRNGYRSVLAGAAATGAMQFLGRFRPSAISARTVAVINGGVYVITDPSSETASDGAATLLGTPFGVTDVICGDALGTNYYLGCTNAAVPLQRIDANYVLSSLVTIPAGVLPSSSTSGGVTWTPFSGITPTVSGCVLQSSTNTGLSGMASTWRAFTKTNNGNDDPVQGSYANYKFAAPVNASGCDWLAVAVSPHTQDSKPATSYKVTINGAVDVSGSPGTWQKLGDIYDTPLQGGSPNAIFLDLRTFDSTTRAAFQWLQFILTDQYGGKFIVYGYAFLPGKPVDPPPINYYVDFYDPVSGNASGLTPVLAVSTGNTSVAGYPDSYMNYGEPTNDGGVDTLFSSNSSRVWNVTAPSALPLSSEIGTEITISGTAPTFPTPATVTARLWKDTDSGRRFVNQQTGVTSGGAYSIIDYGGIGVLANDLYIAGGSAPVMNALAGHAGRLVAGLGQRLYISSYLATSAASNFYPQWPAIALEDADGWNFDIFPSSLEQIQCISGDGDAVYVLTQETVYSLSDLTPGSLPYLVFRRGALGRTSAVYAESTLFWCSYDGVYAANNTASINELSQSIRTIYTTWLLPDQNVTIGYQARKLFVIQGAKFLRYDFVTNRWTRGTLNDTVERVAFWMGTLPSGVASVVEQLWLLASTGYIGRWQAAATADMEIGTNPATGSVIPNWRFSTGFDLTPAPAVISGILVDTTTGCTVTISKTVAAANSAQARTFTITSTVNQDEVWFPLAADLRGQKFRFEFAGSPSDVVKRALFERVLVDAKGG